MKQLTTRQVSIMIFVCAIATKMLALPSLLIETSGNSVWLAVITMFLIDACFLPIICVIAKRFPDLTFKQFLERGFGKVLSRIFLFLLGVLLTLKVAMLARECYEFYNETSYVDLSWVVFLLPLILVLAYLGTKKIRSIGRGGEIFIYFIILALVMAFLLSMGNIDVSNVLPLLPNGISPVFLACFRYSFWFGDFLILFLCLGDVKIEKHSTIKFFTAYSVAMVAVLCLCIAHYSLFGAISGTYKTSIVDVIEYVPRLSTTGRFSWIVVFLWPIAMIFAMCVYQFLASLCFQKCFNITENSKPWLVYSVIALSLAFLIMTVFSENLIIKLVTNYAKYYVLCVQYLFPLTFPFLIVRNIKKEKQYGKEIV